MKKILALVFLAALTLHGTAQTVPAKFTQRGDGYHAGTSPKQQIGFHGAPPVPQRASINEAYAGAATGTITFTGNPAAADTVTIGTGTYTFTGTITNTSAGAVLIGATADATLSNLVNAVMLEGTGTSGAGYIYDSTTVVNGSALNATGVFAGVGATVAATGTFTDGNSTNATAGSTATIGGTTYRFESTMTQVNDVEIGGSADATLLSLAKTINGTGTAGTDMFAGTPANSQVSSTSSVSSHTIVITALTAGASGNTIATTTTASSWSWGAATLAGGTSAVNLVAAAAGTAGNSDVLTKSSSALTVSGSGTLSGGTATPSATQDAVLVNELRDALVQKGLIKGSD